MGDIVDGLHGSGRPGDSVRIAKPWHWKRIFALPVGLAGLYLLWLSWSGAIAIAIPIDRLVGEAAADGTVVERASVEEFDDALNFALALIVGVTGFCMALPSLLIGLSHEGWDFSPDRRTVVQWWGFGVRWFSKPAAPNPFVEIAVRKEVRRGNRGRRADFVVSLAGTEGPSTVAKFASYREARQAGEQLAKRLQWPMSDDAGPERIRRTPEELDHSVRDRARSLGARPARPTPPDPCTVMFEEAEGTLEVHIAPPGLRGPSLRLFFGSLAGAVAGFVLLVWPFMEGYAPRPGDSDQFVTACNWGIRIVTWSPVLYLLFGLAVPAYWRSRIQFRLEVTRDLLRVHRASPAGVSGVELDAREIEQITVAPRAGDAQRSPMRRAEVVSVRSDAGFVEFGAGLTDLERPWLRDMLLYYLAG